MHYERLNGEYHSLVYKAKYGWNIFGYYKGIINTGWYAPTLKQAKKLADALVHFPIERHTMFGSED